MDFIILEKKLMVSGSYNQTTKHRNYAKESISVLYQYFYLLSERQKAPLIWSRCVNTRGVPCANIPFDLHMEHLNRRLKSILRGMGSNTNTARVQRAGESIHHVQKVCEVLEKQTAKQVHIDHRPYPSYEKNLNTICQILIDEKSS